MNLRHARRVAPAAAVAAALIGGLVVAGPAAADAPPYEPDSNSVGTLTFYDTSGNVVTSGSTTTAPFAAYAVGSALPRSGDKQAQLLFANPNKNAIPANWYREQVGNYTQYPLTTGPANVQTASQTMPVVAGTSDDQTLDGFESDSAISTDAGYQNVVQIRLKTANSSNMGTTTYDVADVSIDPVNHTWTQIYPVVNSNPTDTSTALSVSPNPATSGSSVTLSATVSPSTAAGSVQFKDGANNLGGAVVVSSGKATLSTSTLSVGTHSLTAVFSPSAPTQYNPSTSTAVSQVVKAPVPDSTSVSAAGSKTINYGSSASITGTLKDTTNSSKSVSGQSVQLQTRPTTSNTWTTAATVKASSKGALAATVKPGANSYYRWSFPGNSSFKSATSSQVTINVNWTLSGAVNHSSIKANQSVLFYGTVNPARTGTKVILQQWNGKTYVNTKYTATVKKQKLPNGQTTYGYVISTKLTSKKTYAFRATVAATSSLHAGYSSSHNVKVS